MGVRDERDVVIRRRKQIVTRLEPRCSVTGPKAHQPVLAVRTIIVTPTPFAKVNLVWLPVRADENRLALDLDVPVLGIKPSASARRMALDDLVNRVPRAMTFAMTRAFITAKVELVLLAIGTDDDDMP